MASVSLHAPAGTEIAQQVGTSLYDHMVVSSVQVLACMRVGHEQVIIKNAVWLEARLHASVIAHIHPLQVVIGLCDGCGGVG